MRSAASRTLASVLLTTITASTVIPTSADAFCGFFVSGADAQLYNNASQVVLLRKGNHTVMTMSNNYKGPPEDFAMVVPVPVVLQKENVKTLSPDVFKHIDELSAPRLVEYWEQDPCYAPPPMKAKRKMAPSAPRSEMARDNSPADDLGVTVEAKFEVGEYQILILSAKESGGLETWLKLNKYNIPKGAAAALAPYIRDQMKFFVAKVDIKKVRRDESGVIVLSPLRFGFDAGELRLPVRLGLLNAESKQDLIVYVLSPDSRYEVANYPNVFVPTNIEVADAVRKSFGGFYAELFDEAMRRANQRAVITEYAWQTTSCDPCPTPPLSLNDLHMLGDEQVFPELAAQPIAAPAGSDLPPPAPPPTSQKIGLAPPPAPSPPVMSMPPPPPRMRRPFFGRGPSWVLTRMHTRYDRQTLNEDLLFRTAAPVWGGRANWDGTLGDHGAVVQQGGSNNFQGRYIIRHYWEGKVSCDNPRYGRWGGRPGLGWDQSAASSSGGNGRPEAAKDLANAPRGKVKLSEVVQSPVPELGLRGVTRKLRPGETPQPTPQ
jgi:hypothetical protein